MTTQNVTRNFQDITTKRRWQKLGVGLALLTGGILGMAGPERVAAADNMALGRPYTLSPKPNYGLCTDPDDTKQLTDGVYSSGADAQAGRTSPPNIWVLKSTVGWQNASPVIMEIDLGQSQPIGGISFSTASQLVAGVVWPQALMAFVSDDAKTWRFVGDLVTLSARHQQAPVAGPHRFTTHELRAHGRFVSVAMVSTAYAFCDEIEVYRGSDASRDEVSPTTTNIREFVTLNIMQIAVTRRLSDDLAAVRTLIGEPGLSSSTKAQFDARLQEAETGIDHLPPTAPEGFKAILPLNATHAKILGVYGALLKARGLPELFVGKQHRYAYLPWMAIPSKAEAPKLSVEMMSNEFRADSFLLTNASDAPTQVTLRVAGLPGAPSPDWLSLSVVPWTDTAQLLPVADALVKAEYADGAFQCTVPAGLTLKFWLNVDSSKLPPGAYDGTLLVEKKQKGLLERLGFVGPVANLPVSVRVSPVSMARPRLSLCMWDYTNGTGHRGLTTKNMEAAQALMRSHFVDSPWATAEVLPQNPNPSFAALDEWIKRWPEARHYFVFASVPDNFGGAKIGTPEFDAGVGAWAAAIAGHMHKLGLAPKQLAVCLVDEPKNDKQDEIIAAWARAIKAATPELGIFQDPVWERPDQTKIQDAITLADILCPNVAVFLKGGAPVAGYFAARRAAGQALWFYQCSGPVRHFDPQSYYRGEAWLAFQHEADGIGFWAFGDLGGAPNSWNEYTGMARLSFAPAFIGTNDATDSIHWQAVREGIEDHECLAMVRDAARQSGAAAWKAKADELLNEARATIAYPGGSKYGWELPTDPGLMDAYRLRALKLLEVNKNQPRGEKAP